MWNFFILIGQMPFLAPTLDNADPLFALGSGDSTRFLSAPRSGSGSRPSYGDSLFANHITYIVDAIGDNYSRSV